MNNIIPNIKIFEYNGKYNKEINDFVNWSMHTFIGRPLKKREDLLNIKEYYIKKGGNFWIAIDENKNKIIGTIALENRNTIGILKRFYIDKDYQRLGIGSSLYTVFESYVETKTNIKSLYLACGQSLTNAHNFYKKNGWEQLEKLDIDIHVANDDDFFKKDLQRARNFS